jgi:hypothetical protein
MALFALCVNPLLCHLDTHLKGVRLGRTGLRTAVVAYTDDVTIFVTQRGDFRVIRDAIQRYEKASGARLNIQKSKALAVERWTGTENELDVDFIPDVRILGITFSNTIDGAHTTAGHQRPHKLRPKLSKHSHENYVWLKESDMCTV